MIPFYSFFYILIWLCSSSSVQVLREMRPNVPSLQFPIPRVEAAASLDSDCTLTADGSDNNVAEGDAPNSGKNGLHFLFICS